MQVERGGTILPQFRTVHRGVVEGVLHPPRLIEVSDVQVVPVLAPEPAHLHLRQLQLRPVSGEYGQRLRFLPQLQVCDLIGGAVVAQHLVPLLQPEGLVRLGDSDHPGWGGYRGFLCVRGAGVYQDAVGALVVLHAEVRRPADVPELH
ncbi:hypothetical protein AB1I64_24665, partial [[Clostridium] symbiosum]